MPKTVDVELAGQRYTLTQKPIREARAWRQQLKGPFSELVTVLEGAESIELNNATDIAGLVRALSGTLIGSIDILLDLLFDYSADMAKDRKRIEAEAYDDEALSAFVEVLKLVYPFGGLLALVSGDRASRT